MLITETFNMAEGVAAASLGSQPLYTSTFAQFKASVVNTTSYLNPSAKDLLMVMPRMISRAGTFAFETIPEAFDNLLGVRHGGTYIAEATGEGVQAMAAASAGMAPGVLEGAGGAAMAQGVRGQGNSFAQAFSFQNMRTFGGVGIEAQLVSQEWLTGALDILLHDKQVGTGMLHCGMSVRGELNRAYKLIFWF